SISQFIDSEVQGAGSGESYFAEYRMRALDNNNHYSAYSSTVMIEFLKFIHNSPGNSGSNATNKINNSGSAELSYNYELSQNYPNPFNPTTTISYSIQNAGEVSLKVYDMLGTEVASLVNENQEAGNYSLTFNAAELPSRSGSALTSGIYFYTLTSGNFMETKKLILLK
ncbi:MAG: T9SS type A sorting domain-containing protein, partial [Ignavibacteria bacterium]|nr:T9SS type A sorting domain-containing protein [Ignavibacteria bacterium]